MKLIYYILRLFKQKNKGFSVNQTLKEIKKDKKLGNIHYSDLAGELDIKFGGFERINVGGQWTEFTPKGEIQRNKWFDTFNCTNYNTENPIQTSIKKQYGIEEEYTERYAGILSGIRIGFGGSPHNAAEVVRKYGMLPYEFLPFDDTLKSASDYYKPKPMTPELIKEAQKWLDRFDFGHEWIWNFSHKNMMKMLEYSPLGIGVYAWSYNGSKGVYEKPNWATDNHWTTLVGYKEGEYWIVFDSYKEGGTFIKHLDWNYPFAFAKRYYVKMKGNYEQTMREEGKKIYEAQKGKRILVVDTGEVYHVKDNYILEYEFWATSSKWFQDILDDGLRKKEKAGEFIGISRADFDKLEKAVILAGGKITANEKVVEQLRGLINKLK